MTLETSILQFGTYLQRGIVGGLVLDSARNYTEGNYQLGTLEVLGAGYLIVKDVIETKHQQKLKQFDKWVRTDLQEEVQDTYKLLSKLDSAIIKFGRNL